ncbi:hypothetical protein Lal_00031785 [Lupinus albus]|nr:hypothetical protein Lal_00031785 [Lupinus albus]
MAKPIPIMGLRKNGRIGSPCFNNTIVTVTDVRGRVISWSFTGYMKSHTICRSNCSSKYYSNNSISRHATDGSHDKRSRYQKRCNIKSYS